MEELHNKEVAGTPPLNSTITQKEAGGESLGKPSKEGETRGKTSAGGKEPQSRSVFHVDLPSSENTTLAYQECLQALETYADLLLQLSGAGTTAAKAFKEILKDTPYTEIAGQFYASTQEIETITQSNVKQLKADSELSWTGLTSSGDREMGEGKKGGEQDSSHVQVKGLLFTCQSCLLC